MNGKNGVFHPTKIDHLGLAKQLLVDNPPLVNKIAAAIKLEVAQVEVMLAEVIKFLSLIHWSNQKLTPPHRLDLAWHELILFTRAYATFCEEVFQRFMHHQPGGTQSENHRQLRQTLKLYTLVFGEPKEEFWGQHGYWSKQAQCGACLGEGKDELVTSGDG